MRYTLLAICLLIAGVAPASQAMQQSVDDVYTRVELKDPAALTFVVTMDLSATSAGSQTFRYQLPAGSTASDVSALDRLTGAQLKATVDGGALSVQLARPVPKGGETRLRLVWTERNSRVYATQGDTITFTRELRTARHAALLPAGFEVVSCNLPVQVIEEADGRLLISFWNTTPMMAPLELRARRRAVQAGAAATARVTSPAVMSPGTPATAPVNELANLRVSERAIQDREIVYFLKSPETHSFSLYHDYTESRPGIAEYRNVVRGGSTVSEPSAILLDTAESLKVETVKEGDAEVVIIRFPPVQAGRSSRLRITETYTDPGRYGLVDGQLVWHRSFGRPANDVVLPAGWYLTDTAIPGVISTEADGRTRVAFLNPRPDSIDVVIKARRR